MKKVLSKISGILAFLLTLVLCILIKPIDSFASDPTSAWTPTTSLPYLLASHVSFSSDNKVFVIGGSAVTGQSKFDVLTATPSTTGSINSWTTTSLTPTALIFHNLAKKDNYIYILGGKEENPGSALDYVNKVYLGVLNNDGVVTNWQLVNSLPEKRGLGGAVVSGNRIYYAGGRFNDAITKSEVFGADIKANGTLGVWSQVGSLPEPLFGFGMVEYNNNLIIVGGINGNVYRDKTYKTTVDPNGTISAWTDTTPLPEPVYRAGVIRVGSQLITVGGHNGINPLDKVYYTNIDSDGTLGTWQTSSNTLPQAVGTGAAITYSNGYLYLTGGYNGNYLNTVYLTQIGVANGEDKFDLPFSYFGRPTNDQGVFRSAFWQRLTAAFDHTFRGGIHRPFTGNTYRVTDCLRGIVGISCYDSHNGTDFDDVPDNPVYSVGSGEVIYTSGHNGNSCTPNAGGFGCVVIAQYPSQGVFGLYAHLGKINVNAGDEVNAKDELGEMGATGCPGCGSHLHFGVMKSLDASLSSVAKSMTKRDWDALLFTIRPFQFQIGGFRAFCSYRAPNGQRFSFQDPSGWKGQNPDPWTLDRPDGCEVESPYLWKFDVGTSSP